MSKPVSIRALLLFVGLVTAQNECYAAANKRVGSSVVPCGRLGGDAHSACCYSGDLCLSDSACWDPGTNVTYLYGCTDSSYEDAVCPWKCGADFDDYWWVGLLHCSTTSDNQWACNHPTEITQEIIEVPPEECDSDNALAFAGPAVLQPILSLPVAVGGETEYFTRVNPTSYSLDPDYTPSALTVETTASVPASIEYISVTVSVTDSSTSSSTTSSSSSSSSSTTEGASTAAATTTPSATTEPTATAAASGLSTGAKAGIGAGVAAGVLIPAALIAFFCLHRRRRRKQQAGPLHPAPPMKHTYEPPSAPLPRYEQQGPAELPGSQTSPAEAQNQPLLGVGDTNRWSNSPTVSSWSSPGMTHSQSRNSVSPVPTQGQPLVGAAKERQGVHELG